ncbi:MAG: arsenate reductase ArsC, partial [Thaumarchaeota archaeon]|nr:arsenate reductase ArsC [Nitrososphaerota archaeon]
APAVNPVAIQVMNERMINMSQQRPKMVTTEMIQDADLVVTMGCSLEEVCPLPLLTQMKEKMIDWQLENPKDKPIERVREIRDDIDNRVRGLFTKV